LEQAKPGIARFLPPLWVITIIVVVLGLWLLFALKEIFVLLVVGYALAYIIEPLLSYLERNQIRRSLGVIVIVVLGILIISLLAVTAIPTLVREFGELGRLLPHYLQTAQLELMPYLEQFKKYLPEKLSGLSSLESPMETITAISQKVLEPIFSSLGKVLLQGYSVTLFVANIALLPFIVFYIAVDFPELHQKALHLFPVSRRNLIKTIFGEIDQYVSAFVRGQLTVGAILACLYTVGLASIGVELWLILGLLSGFGNLIPYLGFLVGIILSSVMALVTFGDLTHLLYVWGLYAVVQFLESTFITPRIVGKEVGLSPLVVILSIFAAGKLLGILGIFLAIPLAAIIRVLGRYFYRWMLSQPLVEA
jgi:predicted PurR-regulated permease PerM